MSKIILLFGLLLTIVPTTRAQYVPADTLRINPLLVQAEGFFKVLKQDSAFAKADTVRGIIAQIFDQNGIETHSIQHLKIKSIYFQQGKNKHQNAVNQIEVILKQSLPQFCSLDSIEQANNYWILAKLYYQLSDYNKVLRNLSESYSFLPKMQDTTHISKIKALYFRLAELYWAVGAADKANQLIQQVTNIIFHLPESQQTASDFINIGDFFNNSTQFHKTIQYYQKALLLYHKNQDKTISLFSIYHRIGRAYHRLNQLQTALESYQKGLELVGNQIEAFGFLANMSEVYRDMQKYDKNLEYIKRSMSVLKQFAPDEYPLGSYMRLGLHYNATQQYTLAEMEYQKVLGYADQPPYHRAQALENLAHTKIKQNHYKAADSLLQVALKVLKYGEGWEKCSSLLRLKYILWSKGVTERALYTQTHEIRYLKQSRKTYEDALAILQIQKGTIHIAADKRIFQLRAFDLLENAIKTQVLFQNTLENKKAFDYSEQNKAHLVHAQIKESDALQYAGIPDSLLRKEYRFRLEMAWYEKKRKAQSSDNPDTSKLGLELNHKLVNLQQQYQELKSFFEQKYPAYYRLKYDMKTVDIPTIQNNILNKEQTLLSYFVGDSSIFIFVVRQDTFAVFDFKKDFPLESWVRQLRGGLYGYHTTAAKTEHLYETQADSFVTASYQLYSKLLKPVSHLLTNDLVILPDGILGYVPFDVLLSELPKVPTHFKTHAYLGHKHIISYNYSATLWQEMLKKKHLNPPTKNFIGFAPYYDGDTTLLAARFPEDSLLRKNLDSLKYSGEEVFQIQKMMRGDVLLNHLATKQAFEDTVRHYSIVHLATHGKANDKIGDYCFLAFSEQKDSMDNELLYARDIYNLTLNADLVVLSACETGVGELNRGEGIVSLARAFAYSGAKSIVTTLWSINDKSTMQLMKYFYHQLKNGKSKDYALWKSKKKYLESVSHKKAHPFYWSAFIPIGDMKPIQITIK